MPYRPMPCRAVTDPGVSTVLMMVHTGGGGWYMVVVYMVYIIYIVYIYISSQDSLLDFYCFLIKDHQKVSRMYRMSRISQNYLGFFVDLDSS